MAQVVGEEEVPEVGVGGGGGRAEVCVGSVGDWGGGRWGEDFLAPFFEGVHAQDYLVGDGFFEVGVFHAVTCVGEGYPTGVCAVLFDSVGEGEEVAG